MNWGPFYGKKLKTSHNAEKTEKGDPLGEKFFPKKSLGMPKKLKTGDLLVSSGILCYAGNLCGAVPWVNGYNLASSNNFVELLG